jgi:hypothetical protein
MAISSSYLTQVLNTEGLIRYSQNVIDALKPYVNQFDSIAFRGMSGALIGPVVAMALNKNIIMVRKKDGNHSYMPVEGYIATKSYVIVDDFIDSGATIKIIKDEINKWKDHPNYNYALTEEQQGEATCFAVVCYLWDYHNSGYGQGKWENTVKALGTKNFLFFSTKEDNLNPVVFED